MVKEWWAGREGERNYDLAWGDSLDAVLRDALGSTDEGDVIVVVEAGCEGEPDSDDLVKLVDPSEPLTLRRTEKWFVKVAGVQS